MRLVGSMLLGALLLPPMASGADPIGLSPCERTALGMHRLVDAFSYADAGATYRQLLDDRCALTADDHRVAAHAARRSGDVTAERERLLAAWRSSPSEAVGARIAEIDQGWAWVRISDERGRAPLRPWDGWDLDADQAESIRHASSVLSALGGFEGLLPVGMYVVGRSTVEFYRRDHWQEAEIGRRDVSWRLGAQVHAPAPEAIAAASAEPAPQEPTAAPPAAAEEPFEAFGVVFQPPAQEPTGAAPHAGLTETQARIAEFLWGENGAALPAASAPATAAAAPKAPAPASTPIATTPAASTPQAAPPRAQIQWPAVDGRLITGHRATGDAAVVVGIEDYLKIPDVPHARRDAEAFRSFLVYTRGVPLDRVRHLDGVNREMIAEAVAEAGRSVGEGGTVWVYFAGHGAASPKTGERLLLGDDVRSDPGQFDARGVPVSEIERLATSGGGRALLVLDTCYAGVGRGGADLIAGTRLAVPVWAVASAGALQWNAAGPSELSRPLDAQRHGAFTYLAIGAMRGWADGELDGRPDGRVTAEEAHAYVTRMLKVLDVRGQNPSWEGAGGLSTVVLTEGALEAGPQAP